MSHASYLRFLAMIATSTAAMFALTYLTTWSLDHVYWSETRAYAALYGGATMAVIMLTFMLPMYRSWPKNLAIYTASAVLFLAALYLVRSQATIQDVAYMKAMIPHHSIAVLTSRRAEISDPRVRKLADIIIDTQLREIEEMKQLIAEIEGVPAAQSQ